MNEVMEFAAREDFRKWMFDNCQSNDGIGIRLGKAGEALEGALCFGWIDGQMQSIDDKTY